MILLATWLRKGQHLLVGGFMLLWLWSCASSQQQGQQQSQQNYDQELEDDENYDENSENYDQNEDSENSNSENGNSSNSANSDEEDSYGNSANGNLTEGGNSSAEGGNVAAEGANASSSNGINYGNGSENTFVENTTTNNAMLENSMVTNNAALENSATNSGANSTYDGANALAGNASAPMNPAATNPSATNPAAAPAPVNAAPPAEPAPAPVPPAEPAVASAPVAPTPLEVEPVLAKVRWVGYVFDEANKKLKVEIVTEGEPEYQMFQETNRAGQPEIVIRFFDTELMSRIRRPLDASEFRSPVAYVRMRKDETQNQVDVVLTMRDKVKPRLFVSAGNVLLTFDIPEYYFGNTAQGVAQQVGSAEQLAMADVTPMLEEGSRTPRDPNAAPAVTPDAAPAAQEPVPVSDPVVAPVPGNPDAAQAPGTPDASLGVPDPAGPAFNAAPADGGAPVDIPLEPDPNVDQNGLPSNFEMNAEPEMDNSIQPTNTPENEAIDFEDGEINFNSSVSKEAKALLAKFEVTTRSLSAVAQDNMENYDEEEEEEEENTGSNSTANNTGSNSTANNTGNNTGNTASNPANNTGNNTGGNAANNTGGNSAGNATGNTGNMGNASGNAWVNESENPTSNAALENGSLNNAGTGNTAMNPAANGAPANNTGNAALNAGGNGAAANTSMNAAPVNNSMPANNSAAMNSTMNAAPVEDTSTAADGAIPESTGMDTEGMAGAASSGGGRPVSLEFHKAPLNLVLKSFGEESGNNFIYPAEVGNTEISIHLKNVPWDEALKAILETYGLGMVQVGANVVRIDRLSKMNEYLKDLNNVRQYRVQLEPTRVLVMRLSHGVAKDVLPAVTELLKNDIEKDPRIKLTADERTNSIVAEAATGTLGKIKDVLERLDLETPQIRITSRIVEVAKTANDFLGVMWSNALNFDAGRGLGFGNLPFPNSINSDFTVDPGVAASNTAGNLTMRFGSLNRFLDLDLLLKAEEKRGTTNILQNNTVLVLDRQRAEIIAGTSQFFRPPPGGSVINTQGGQSTGVTSGAQSAAGLSEIKFDLSLEVVPQVTASGNINMQLNIVSDTPTPPDGEQLASKNTRRLNTMMTKRNGETAVIGGIYDTKKTKTVTGIPILSNIPILGALFRSTATSEMQTEMLIMVTPNLVTLADNADAAYQSGFGAAGPAAAAAATPEISDENFSNNGGGNLENNGGNNSGANNYGGNASENQGGDSEMAGNNGGSEDITF